jgi:hypothetical protein
VEPVGMLVGMSEGADGADLYVSSDRRLGVSKTPRA